MISLHLADLHVAEKRGSSLTAKRAPAAGPVSARFSDHGALIWTCLTLRGRQPLEAVQAQAEHASIESTRIYLHLAD